MPSQAKEFGQLYPLDEEGNLVLDVIISKIYLSHRVTYVYKNCWLICYRRLRLCMKCVMCIHIGKLSFHLEGVLVFK